MCAKRIGCLAILICCGAISACAQTRVGFNLTGMWTPLYHEDELERTDPGSPAGDYLGLPINDDDRLRADTWDADVTSVLEHQCIPHSSVYSMRGPTNLKITTIDEPFTHSIVAFVIDGSYDGPRTIWMDGRQHPGKFAAHTWSGFSTGTWEGDTLRIETTHIKSGYLRRNGVAFSDQAVLTEFYTLQDKYLTLTSIAEDPVYLTEPLVRSESWVWNPLQTFNDFGYWACQPHLEIPMAPGKIPHHLPGTNTVILEFSDQYGIPFDATRGGAETMYPDYLRKLRQMKIPHPKVFENQFAREHEGAKADGK